MNRGDQWMNSSRRDDGWIDQSIPNDYQRIIHEKSVSIFVIRERVKLDPQTVRIESIDNVPFERFAGGQARLAFVNGTRVRIYGYKNHPTTANTDIQFGDRFLWEDQLFEVLQVQPEENWFLSIIAEARD